MPGVSALFEAAEQHYGALDVLVNKPGVTRDTLPLRMKSAQWNCMIGRNFRACSTVYSPP